jgi:hypothetical protein
MKIALVNEERSEPSPRQRGLCPYCGLEMIAKCGKVRLWHWAHKSRSSCDPWWEPETEWHRRWKAQFPTAWQEVIHVDEASGERHISDVKTRFGLVIEFQHSPIETMELESREGFYKNMIWIVDGDHGSTDRQYFIMGLLTSEPASFSPLVYYFGWSGQSRLPHNWAQASSPVYLDFGHENVIWKLLEFDPDEKSGAVMPTKRASFVEACSNGEPIPSIAADANDPRTYHQPLVRLQ